MELSDELIEALDAVVYTWSKPRVGDSRLLPSRFAERG
jgi:hypothetical protein